MAIITRCRVPREVFNYTPETKTLCAEISDLGKSFNFSQVFDDACDIGLAMATKDNNGLVHFAVTAEERDAEGDIQMWKLEPIFQSVLKHPSCKGITMVLFND